MTDIMVVGSNGLSDALPKPSELHYDEYKKQKRDAHKKGSVSTEILSNARAAVLVVTVYSLLGGLDYELKLGTYREWLKAAQTPP